MPRFQSISLRMVLVIPFVLEVMAAVGLTAYFAYRNGQEAVHDLAHRSLSEVSDRVQQSLDGYLQIPVFIARNTTNSIRLGILDWRNLPTLERYFWQQMQDSAASHNEINAIGLADRQNNSLAVERSGKDAWTVRVHDRSTYPGLHRYWLNAQGERTDAVERINNRSNASLHDHIQDEAGWRLVATSETEQPRLNAVYVQPFFDRTNTLRGTTETSVDLAHIGKHLEGLRVGQSGQAFIVEPNGNLIASSTGENPLFKAALGLKLSSRVDERSPGWLKASRSRHSVTNQTAQFLVRHFGSFKQITTRQQLSFEAAGKRYFVQTIPLHTRKLNWLAVVVIPETDFAAQIDRNYATMVILCSAALLGAIALGLLTAQQIAQPILRLSRASRDFMLGKLDIPIDASSRITELAILSHTFNEMTEHLQASFDEVNHALQESKEKFTTVFRTCPDPILITTLADGKMLEVNESFLRLLGCSREQVLNRTSVEIALWQNAAEREQFLQELERVGRVYNREFSTLTQYGTKATVLVSSEAIELDGKKCLLTVAKDITDRKQAEEALRISEERFRTAFDIAAIGMNIAALNGRFLQVNPAFCRMVGYTAAELLQMSYYDITHLGDQDTNQEYDRRLLSGEISSFQIEKRYIHKEGYSVRALLNTSLVRDSQQQPLYFVSLVQESNTRKQIEGIYHQWHLPTKRLQA